MNADWEIMIKVTLRNAMDHEEPNPTTTLLECIKEEGGLMQIIAGWCNPQDLEMVGVPIAVLDRKVLTKP